MNPIKAFRLYLRLAPIFDEIERVAGMKFSVNMILQIAALVAQGANATMPLLPPNLQKWAVVTLTAVQGISAVLAHFSNPDGTSARAAYEPAKR